MANIINQQNWPNKYVANISPHKIFSYSLLVKKEIISQSVNSSQFALDNQRMNPTAPVTASQKNIFYKIYLKV